ncbi:MAG: glutamate--tRNA ligase [Spirochaetales bacterium]|nr:glutamate--tRNA ligase [Spirochaetales bacterium]
MSVRTRYAPSPTGKQHIGSVRTVLFEYLFARSQGGVFYLRIEDTDQVRSTEGAIQNLYETLNWLGIEWDEGPDKGGPFGPYIQSERVELYRKYAEQLVEQGDAYYCFCTPEDVEKRRQQKDGNLKESGYDKFCRTLSSEDAATRKKQGLPCVIRLKVPEEGTTVVDDLLIGEIKRKNRDISPDPVILKSDGFPTYHLAHVVDDHLMQTTHVIRGQEWIPSGPIHVLLFKAFGWEIPKYVHLPMVLGKDGQKLSKRHGSTSVEDFREKGYLPEAMVNYLALIGWSYDDSREFFTLQELEKLFTLEKLNKASGTFDYKKLDWFNGQYIRRLPLDELRKRCLPWLVSAGMVSEPPTADQDKQLDLLMPLVAERLRVLSDVAPLCSFVFKGPAEYNAEMLINKKADKESTLAAIRAGREIIAAMDSLTDEQAEKKFAELSEKTGLGFGVLFTPISVSINGSTVSLPLFGSIRLLGVTEALRRIDIGIAKLEKI